MQTGSLYGFVITFLGVWRSQQQVFFTTHKLTISLETFHFTICFYRIPVSLGNTWINLLSSSEYQPVWVCNELYWDSGEVNKMNFFTTNKMAISLMALDFSLCFHMIPVCLVTSRINLLSSSDCPPVWVIYHCLQDS